MYQEYDSRVYICIYMLGGGTNPFYSDYTTIEYCCIPLTSIIWIRMKGVIYPAKMGPYIHGKQMPYQVSEYNQ